METPTTPNRKHLTPKAQSTPASAGSASSMAGLKKFHVEKVHNLVWLDVLTFQLGSFKRFLHRQLSSVGAIEPIKDNGGRGTEDQIDKGLRECLAPIVTAMNASSNSKAMDIIRTELQIYCTQENEKNRYSHFVKAANTALLLLADIQIGNSRPSPSRTSDDFLLFMVHDPKLMKSVHKGVTYDRKPDIVAAFQCHIRELYKNKGDLLKAVTTAPGKDERPLQWKRALLCVEKKVGKKKIEKTFSKAYSPYSLRDGDYDQRKSIEEELAKKSEVIEENSESSQSQSGVDKGLHSKSGGKRSAEGEPFGPTHAQKKSKNHADDDRPAIVIKAPSAAAQVADYAAEALYNCFGRSHVVNLLVTDSVINVWYFDHECPIQMTGFDFIDNLPYFLLFLFAFQRFSLADWGYIPNIVNVNDGKEIDVSRSWSTPSSKLNVRFSPEQGINLNPRFGLNGRATGIAGGTVTVQGVALSQGVVMKLSYPEKSRVREHLFIKEANEKLNEKQYGDVCDYLPTIMGSQEYHDFDSDLIRKAVLVDPEGLRDRSARIPYFIILPKYEPITSRTTTFTEFLNAFFALVYCHAMLWSVGIEHGDISEGNLMWDPMTQNPKICDFDLSHFKGQRRPSGFANTGTWVFMALELLTEEAMLGEVKRIYRHDLESFFAVLIWILCRYRDGKLLSDPPLEEWNQLLYSECAKNRKYTYRQLIAMEAPNGLSEDEWEACIDATLSNQVQQEKALVEQKEKAIRDLRRKTQTTSQVHEFYESINVLGPTLLYSLFQIGDGPKFVKRLRQRLPNLPSNPPIG